MKYNDIKDVFKNYLPNLKFDKLLYDKIKSYRLGWANKTDEYANFLGSGLLGTVAIRFSTQDDEVLFIDILNIDVNLLKEDLHNLHGIEKKHNVASNPYYLTIAYLVHGFANSKDIGKNRDDAIKELYYLFAYKVFSSLITRRFAYLADESIASAVFEKLPGKYLIKKLGTWQKVFEYRANDILPGGLHWDKVLRMRTDDATRTISDLQTRIREMVNNIYSVLVEVVKANERITSSSLIGTVDDEDTIVDQLDRPDSYYRYLESIVASPQDFINEDYVYIVSVVTNLKDTSKLIKVLTYISNNTLNKKVDTEFMDVAIKSTLEYIRTKGIVNDYRKRIDTILFTMKGYWSSSSIKNTEAVKSKKYVQGLVKKATGINTEWVVSNLTINVMLYVFLRSMMK